jgi:hypothetical protein
MRFSARKPFFQMSAAALEEKIGVWRVIWEYVIFYTRPARLRRMKWPLMIPCQISLLYESRKHKTRERLISREFQFSLLT